MKVLVAVSLLLGSSSAFAAAGNLHGQDLSDAGRVGPEAGIVPIPYVVSLWPPAREAQVELPLFMESPQRSQPDLEYVLLGSLAGWGLGALAGGLMANDAHLGVYLGGTFGSSLGAHMANRRNGMWPLDFLAAGAVGMVMVIPGMGLCWEGCTRDGDMILATGLGVLQVVTATATERGTARLRRTPSR